MQLGQGLEKIILDAKFTVFNTTPGFRGAALLNRQGQAIGLFFQVPGIVRRMYFKTLTPTIGTC